MFMHITKFNQIEKKQEKCKKSCGGLIKFIVKIMKPRFQICNRKYSTLFDKKACPIQNLTLKGSDRLF